MVVALTNRLVYVGQTIKVNKLFDSNCSSELPSEVCKN